MACQRSNSTKAHICLFLLPPALLSVFSTPSSLQYKQINTLHHIEASRHGFKETSCHLLFGASKLLYAYTHTYIYIYMYAIIVSRFHNVPGSGTRVITTSSLKMILFLQKQMLHGCVYFSPVLDLELCYFPFSNFVCGRREQTQQTHIL